MNRIQRRFIRECVEGKDLLDDWQRGFIEALAARPEDAELTENENHKLNECIGVVNRGASRTPRKRYPTEEPDYGRLANRFDSYEEVE